MSYIVYCALICSVYLCHHPLHLLKLFNGHFFMVALLLFIYFGSMSGI